MPTISEKEMTQPQITEILVNAKKHDGFKIIHGKGETTAYLYDKIGGDTPLTARDITKTNFVTARRDADVSIHREQHGENDFTIWRYSGPDAEDEIVISLFAI